MKKRRILRSERGFTLVELGIVIAIIAILAAVAYPTYTGMRKRAYMAEARAVMQELRVTAWAEYLESNPLAWQAYDSTELEAINGASSYWVYSVILPTGDATSLTIKAEGKDSTPVKGETITLTVETTGKATFGS